MSSWNRIPRWTLWLPLAAAVVAVAFVVWLNRRSSPPSLPDAAFPLPPFSESPFLNTRPDARYVGIAACKECHAANHRSYLQTAHSKALSDLDPKVEPPDGAFDHPPSGRSYRVYREGNRLRHEEILRTPGGQALARLDLPIRYLIGSGHFSRSYLVEAEGFLVESPITWYASRKHWGMSPGYDKPGHWSFERPATVDCLVCHAGRAETNRDAGQRVIISEQAIGCESCHGPGSLHVQLQRGGNHRKGDDDLTIVHPRKLTRPLLESICSVCHLHGEASIYLRGRAANSFRPGMPLTDYRINYAFASGKDQMTVVGHVEQLRRSRCYQKSTEMSCLTCHDPHQGEKPRDLGAFYRQKCLSCHTSQACTMELAQRLKKDPADSCTTCHMPRGDTEIPHIAFTHHRIGRHTRQPDPTPGRPPDLVPVEDAPHLASADRQRNLGLAYLHASIGARQREHALEYQERAQELLKAVHRAGLRDGATLAGLARISQLDEGHPRATERAQEALAAPDLPVEGRIQVLQILVQGFMQEGSFEEAFRLLEKLTRLRRTADDWRLLAVCLLAKNQADKALQALEQALAIQPFHHQIHAGLADVHRRLGNLQRSREHHEKAQALAQHSKSLQPR